jgi:hypothetical protein
MNYISNITRSQHDPKILRVGPSSLGPTDRLARGLGWFSLGLGLCEFIAPRRITRALGMRGMEPLVRAYGVREIASGMLSLSVDKQVGLQSRLVGDGLDIATLLAGFRNDNPRKHSVALALLMVAGVTALDCLAAQGTRAHHARPRGERRLYGDRTGFPKGIQGAKGAAKDFTRLLKNTGNTVASGVAP